MNVSLDSLNQSLWAVVVFWTLLSMSQHAFQIRLCISEILLHIKMLEVLQKQQNARTSHIFSKYHHLRLLKRVLCIWCIRIFYSIYWTLYNLPMILQSHHIYLLSPTTMNGKVFLHNDLPWPSHLASSAFIAKPLPPVATTSISPQMNIRKRNIQVLKACII